MSIDRSVVVAFGAWGTVWVLAQYVFFYELPILALVGAVSVLVFTPALASARIPTGPTLLAAWTVEMLATGVGVRLANGDGDLLIGELVLLSGVGGTFLIAIWVVPSFGLLLLIDPEHRNVTDDSGRAFATSNTGSAADETNGSDRRGG